ncbi:MAG: 5-oxoprolinase subunit PxpB [Mycobacteriaceae bacterium]
MKFRPAGEGGLLVEVDSLSSAINLYHSCISLKPAGIIDLVPAARTLLIIFEPKVIKQSELIHIIHQALSLPTTQNHSQSPLVYIPVIYDGPDLTEVAEQTGLSKSEVIHIHTSAPWVVAFTGFAPGFAYLTRQNNPISVRRRNSPRATVPAGSVALASEFSGIYPCSTPGGWQLIGHTNVSLWDEKRITPALLKPGMEVKFVETL